MIVLDASVLIAYLDSDDAHHTRAETLLARDIEDDFAASTLTLAEVLVMPARERRLDAARDALEGLEVSELAFPTGSAVKLAQLRTGTTLTMPDCCVLLVAEEHQARVASFDDRLSAAAASRGLVVLRN